MNQIAVSVLALLREPEQLARLRADPSLNRSAVEELLRYATITQSGLTRTATEDVEVGGQTIRAGEGVISMLSAANRDDEVFPDGTELNLGRDNARHHVAFGFGAHQCLGQPLARAELQIALDSILTRLPGLRLAVPFEQIQFKQGMFNYGVDELPIAW